MSTKHFNVGLWRYSKQFFEAASQLRGDEEELCPAPIYFLYCHSIELAIKAFLVTKGHSEKQLRKIGHNLQKAWQAAKDLNINDHLDDAQEISETIELIGPYYEAKELEYIVTGFKTFPRIVHMHNSAEHLVSSIGKIVRS